MSEQNFKFNNGFAGSLISEAVKSNCIKLLGPAGDLELAERAADIDAAYIRRLYLQLTDPESLQKR